MSVLAVDNVLWGGNVIKPENDTESTLAIRAFNNNLAQRSDIDLRCSHERL